MPELLHEIEVRPAFYDVDPMAVVWHGNYVRYFELARAALMEKFNYGYEQMRESGYLWPIVDLRVKYVKPATLNQPLKVRAEITEFESRLRVEYLITSGISGDKVTKGYTLQVAVDAKTMELQYVCPKILWERLGVSP
ncbi:MAG: thioesterase family protein [Archangium sp.]|nr:thioesterase family protein [Archangium sp.]MDP3157548.1 thioesterase family protein [Archangium sp.]MDP3574312.1 thioesterase family protein [Archangium sp.]